MLLMLKLAVTRMLPGARSCPAAENRRATGPGVQESQTDGHRQLLVHVAEQGRVSQRCRINCCQL